MTEPLEYERFPTSDDIQMLRNETGMGMYDGKKKLVRDWYESVLQTLKFNVELGRITAEEAVVTYIDFTLKRLETEKAPWER